MAATHAFLLAYLNASSRLMHDAAISRIHSMNLTSDHPYWALKNGLLYSYPSLRQNEKCDVIILGGGISGALAAYTLVAEGLDVILIDKRDIGMGSTSASTALLQYEIDVPLCELTEKIGREDAERAYWLCHGSIDQLEKIIRELGGGCDFQRKHSVYLASNEDDLPMLEEEFQAREQAGIRVVFFDQKMIKSKFSFSRPGAIVSEQGAEVDSYLLTHKLLERSAKKGVKIYDRTEMVDFDTSAGSASIKTAEGWTVRAKHLVWATGYEAVEDIYKKIVTLKSSFALVSEPLDTFEGWWDRALLWETAQPYFYMRTTADERALIGGADDVFRNPVRRDALIPKKRKHLVKQFEELFPEIPLEVAYSWAGTFGETKDGLAYIGCIPERPQSYYALGFGGNGITYSVVAAEIMRDKILGRQNSDERLFSFSR